MKIIRIAAFLFLTAIASAGVPKKADQAVPLAPGEPVPEVTLRDVDGKAYPLRERLAGQPAVLIFYRGSWCPYCNRHLAALEEIEADLQSLGYRVVAISPDKPEGLKEAIAKNDLGYTLLSDSGAETIRAFGLAFEVGTATRTLYKGYGIDLAKAAGDDHHLLPVPAVYLVDAKGILRYRYFNPNYKERLDPKSLLEEARRHVLTGQQTNGS